MLKKLSVQQMVNDIQQDLQLILENKQVTFCLCLIYDFCRQFLTVEVLQAKNFK